MSESIVLTSEDPSITHLCSHDKRMAKVIKMVGPISYTTHDDYYEFLIRHIINQMLSNKVAAVIYSRLVETCHGIITPESISRLTDEEIKEIGTSNSKVRYIREVTKAVENGILQLDSLTTLSDDIVIKELTKIHGIGIWSAKMFLIFALNRPNILPYEDVAFQQGYSWLYKTVDLKPDSIKKKCRKWSPYASVAARYCYRAVDLGLTKTEFHLHK